MILLGEMRDLETISTALTAAETGHLVFGTLHTQSAPSTIDRIIDVFPAEQQAQVRMQLANTLQGIVTQTLLPTIDGKGRAAALEILFLDDAIRNLIRQGKIEQVYSYMQTGTSRGMQTMEQSLTELIQKQIDLCPRSGRSLEPPGSTRVGARTRRHSDPRPVQRRRTCRHARSRRGAAGGRELAANDPVEPPERVLRIAAARRQRRLCRIVRSVAHRRPGRPGLRPPGDRFRRDTDRRARRLRRVSPAPDRLRPAEDDGADARYGPSSRSSATTRCRARASRPTGTSEGARRPGRPPSDVRRWRRRPVERGEELDGPALRCGRRVAGRGEGSVLQA